MKASFVRLILIGFASLPGRLSAQTGGPVKELTTLELSSTIPGRELEIRFVGSSGASSLVGGPMRTAGDTIFVRTPARLILRPDSADTRTVLDVTAGEPWLHASIASNGWTMNAWGQQVELRRTNGKPILLATFIRSQPTSP